MIKEDGLSLLREASYSKGAKQWVIFQLERDHDPHEIAFEWWLPDQRASR